MFKPIDIREGWETKKQKEEQKKPQKVTLETVLRKQNSKTEVGVSLQKGLDSACIHASPALKARKPPIYQI